MRREDGFFRTVWVQKELDELIEEVRLKIGLSRSSFYRNAILRYLESLGVISSSLLKEGEKEWKLGT